MDYQSNTFNPKGRVYALLARVSCKIAFSIYMINYN